MWETVNIRMRCAPVVKSHSIHKTLLCHMCCCMERIVGEKDRYKGDKLTDHQYKVDA